MNPKVVGNPVCQSPPLQRFFFEGQKPAGFSGVGLDFSKFSPSFFSLGLLHVLSCPPGFLISSESWRSEINPHLYSNRRELNQGVVPRSRLITFHFRFASKKKRNNVSLSFSFSEKLANIDAMKQLFISHSFNCPVNSID